MAGAFSGMHDILLGYDTDLHFEDGDLMLTTGIDYIEREIFKLLITEPGDWKTSPLLGASPNQMTGAANTRENAIKMKDIISNGIRSTVYPAQGDVRIVPTDYDSILVFIDIYIRNEDVVVIPFEFDYVTGFRKLTKADPRVTKPISNEQYKINDISTMKRPNKYWSRIREDRQNI